MIDPSLPLIDLHRHLEGSVRLETIIELSRSHNLELPVWDLDRLRSIVQVSQPQPGVMAFLVPRVRWMVGILVDYDACHRVAYENVIDAAQEGIDYLELRFSPCFMAEPHNLNPSAVVEAVADGVRLAARETAVQVSLIGVISRTYGPGNAWKELGALLSHRDELVGLDLAGDEVNYPPVLFNDHFRKGRDAGWGITIHAGESGGAENIWQAIHQLGATRIGHATKAVQDSELLDYLAKHRVGIETNLTSNVHSSTVPGYDHHPIQQFLSHGLLATINTDDPGISGIDLPHEYNVAAPAARLSSAEIRQAQRNALEIAFLSEHEKAALTKPR